MNYVSSIEPRLTAHRPTSPETSVQALTDWLHDLKQEAVARLDLITDEQVRWSPHPDANHPGVTFWHVARWLDVLAATRAVTAAVPGEQAWIRAGWIQRTGYDPRGIGFLGLGTLTGYSAEQMRAVPRLGREALKEYLHATVADLAAVLASFDVADLNRVAGFGTPFQLVGSTLQGSFGHLGEIDSMVALYDSPYGCLPSTAGWCSRASETWRNAGSGTYCVFPTGRPGRRFDPTLVVSSTPGSSNARASPSSGMKCGPLNEPV